MDLLQDPIGYMEKVGVDQDGDVYRFFKEDVVSRGSKFADTAKYVRVRVHGFLNDPIVTRLLINKNPTMSISKVIESGAIPACRDSEIGHGEDGVSTAWKFIKSIVNRIVQERIHADISQCVPIFFYEDEFQNSLTNGYDKQLATMLDENRKFKLSMNLATTRFGHIGTDMADAVLTCTASKFADDGRKRCGVHRARIRTNAQELKELPNYNLYTRIGSERKSYLGLVEKGPVQEVQKR